MKTENSYPNIRAYVEGLAASGIYHFNSKEAQSSLGVSSDATKLALSRLAKQGIIASPARGFYVVVPPEYRSLGCLPADQFIPALMKRLKLPYYVALLSAAQYYGAAHHRPQEFQVFLGKSRRPIQCGKVRVAFMVRKRITEVPVQSFNTPRGTILVSTPEATAFDLVGYQHHAGGLDQVETVLSELAEQIDPDKLKKAARLAPVPWAQRLGYLLDQVGGQDKTGPLKAYVRKQAIQSTVLLPRTSHKATRRDKDWKLFVNAEVGKLKMEVEQFAFHGVLRFKQSLENYLAMDKLVGKKCFDQGGLLGESQKQIAEVFLRDIALNIYKIYYDKKSKIKYLELKNRISQLKCPENQKLSEYIEKIDKLTPSENCLKNFRNQRLAHLDQLKINGDPNSQFIEINFYAWFLDEVRNHGKLRFMDYMEAFCLYSLSVVGGNSEGFKKECKDIQNKSVIFWAFATKVVKDNSEVDRLLQSNQG